MESLKVKKVIVKKKLPSKNIKKEDTYTLDTNFDLFDDDIDNNKNYITSDIKSLIKHNESLIQDIIESSTDGDNYYINITKNNKTFIKFYLSSTRFCCGIIELGELNVNVREQDHKENLYELINLLPEMIVNKTLMINTNGQGVCIKYEEALSKTKNWTLVKEFKNTTKNTIKMWISNNA